MGGKRAVIGGVWCLSNTVRPVMIPLVLQTKTEKQKERRKEWKGWGVNERHAKRSRFTKNI